MKIIRLYVIVLISLIIFHPVDVMAQSKKRCRPQWRKRLKAPFEEAELMEFVKWIAKKTCYNFIIPDNLRRSRLTLITNKQNLTLRSYYTVFLTTLRSMSISVVKSGGFYRLFYTREARYHEIKTYLNGVFPRTNRDEMITYLLRVKYIEPNRLVSLLRQISSPHARLLTMRNTNIVLIIDYASNVRRVLKIARQLDIEEAEVKDQMFMIQIENGQAQEIVQRVRSIFQVIPKERLKNYRFRQVDEAHRLSKILADERTNRLIVVCSKRAYKNLYSLVKKLDIPLADGGKIRVHYLLYAKADEIAQTLSQLAQGSRRRRYRRRRGAHAGATDLFQGEVRITPDKGTNSLVIVSNQRDYENLMRVIRKLDVRRKQVFIEAVILEISMDKARKLGTVFHGGVPVNDDPKKPEVALFGTQLAGVNSLIFDPSALMGLALGIRGPEIEGTSGLLGPGTPGIPAFGVLLRAIQSNTDVDIISTPHILTATNEEATIQVGQNVPFIAGTSFSTAGLGMAIPIRNIQRQDVALTLKIKPQINAGDRIKMDLNLEITEIAGQDPELGPTTTKRKIKTTIRVKDNQTAVIGGLMRDKVSEGVSKVPILGDIPLFGMLFKMKNKKVEKQNLLVFLTPHIITTADDFRRIFLRKMKERKEFLKNFYARKFQKMKKFTKLPLTSGLVDRIITTSQKVSKTPSTKTLPVDPK